MREDTMQVQKLFLLVVIYAAHQTRSLGASETKKSQKHSVCDFAKLVELFNAIIERVYGWRSIHENKKNFKRLTIQIVTSMGFNGEWNCFYKNAFDKFQSPNPENWTKYFE